VELRVRRKKNVQVQRTENTYILKETKKGDSEKQKNKKAKLSHPPFLTENSSSKLIPKYFGFQRLNLKLRKLAGVRTTNAHYKL
jgi:hypothetical protein